MTSAERAKELLASLLEVRWPSEAEAIPLITQAITQAQNDKLEEAAKRITARILDFEDSDTDPEFDVTDTVVAYELRQVRDDIRSLIEKD